MLVKGKQVWKKKRSNNNFTSKRSTQSTISSLTLKKPAASSIFSKLPSSSFIWKKVVKTLKNYNIYYTPEVYQANLILEFIQLSKTYSRLKT